MELECDRQDRQELPKEGEVWADTTTIPFSVGVVSHTYHTMTGPLIRGGLDRGQSSCIVFEHSGAPGIRVWLASLRHQAGFGPLPPSSHPPTRSGQLQLRSLVNERMYGVVSFTRLIPPCYSPQLDSPARRIRTQPSLFLPQSGSLDAHSCTFNSPPPSRCDL